MNGQYLVKYKTDYDSGIYQIIVDAIIGKTADETYENIRIKILTIKQKEYSKFRIYSVEGIYKLN